MSHGDKVNKLPKNFKIIASTTNAKFAVIANEEKKIYGLQFHPEVIHTLKGKEILRNFIKKIGWEVAILPYEKGHSTSKIIKKIGD